MHSLYSQNIQRGPPLGDHLGGTCAHHYSRTKFRHCRPYRTFEYLSILFLLLAKKKKKKNTHTHTHTDCISAPVVFHAVEKMDVCEKQADIYVVLSCLIPLHQAWDL